jgi:hypothetical protein
MAVRLLVRSVPTTVDAEELYDALRTHHGGSALRDALFIPAAPGQQTTEAFAEYETNAAADAAMAREFWVDGKACHLSRVGPAAPKDTKVPLPKVQIELAGGFASNVSAETVFNTLRGFADILNVETSLAGVLRVTVTQSTVAGFVESVNSQRVMPGLRIHSLSQTIGGQPVVGQQPPQQHLPPYHHSQPLHVPHGGGQHMQQHHNFQHQHQQQQPHHHAGQGPTPMYAAAGRNAVPGMHAMTRL